MKIKKDLTITTHIRNPRTSGPLSKDEAKQLTDFFVALLDLDIAPQENLKKNWRRDDKNQ